MEPQTPPASGQAGPWPGGGLPPGGPPPGALPPGALPPGGPEPAPPPAPDLAESLRGLRDSGKAGIGAAGDAAKALRELLAADVSLARSAAGRSAVFAGVSVMFGVSAWLLLMTALIVVLSTQVGLPWWMSLAGCGLLSLLGAWLALQKATDYFEHTRLKATRRQLARLGIGELSDLMPPPGSPASARAAEPVVRDDARAEGKTPP